MDKNNQDFCTDCPETKVSRRWINRVGGTAIGATILGAFGVPMIRRAIADDERPATREDFEHLLTQDWFRSGPIAEGEQPDRYLKARQDAVERNDVDWFLTNSRVTVTEKPYSADACSCCVTYAEWRCSYSGSCCNAYARGCRKWQYLTSPCNYWQATGICGSCSWCTCS